METKRCPKCSCTMTQHKDIHGAYWYCTNRGTLGIMACGYIEKGKGK